MVSPSDEDKLIKIPMVPGREVSALKVANLEVVSQIQVVNFIVPASSGHNSANVLSWIGYTVLLP